MTEPSAAHVDLDPVLTLAQTMHATPAAYAVLLGAGVSIAAGVPSAWGVVEQLVRCRATLEREDCGDDPAGWFQSRYGTEPAYQSLLESLAATPLERQRLLRSFFEPVSEADPDAALEQPLSPLQPSPAHHALARLVAAGAVRVVLTLNFDRLAETAIRAAGVEPTIVTSSAELAGLAPLHTLRALVVHLHGDYLSADTMLNTDAELDTYSPAVDDFLDRVLTDYGLLAVGWSAAYDPALRAAISRQTARFFTPYWVEPADMRPLAQQLLTARGGVQVTDTADQALGQLADAVTALQARAARHPLTLPVAVATAKRELSRQTVAIALHDRIRDELGRLRQTPELQRTNFSLSVPDEELEQVYSRIEEAALVPCALAATTAYWGNPSTDPWWEPQIEAFARPVRGSGSVALLRSVTLPAAHLLYTCGAAAVAAGRYDLVHRLITEILVTDSNGNREPLAWSAATPSWAYADSHVGLNAPSARMHRLHEPTFVDHLGLGHDAYDRAWETFEILRLVETTHHLTSTAADLALISERRSERATIQALFDEAETNGTADDVRQARADSWREAARALSSYADRVVVDRPHVRVVADYDPALAHEGARLHMPVVGVDLVADLARAGAGAQHPLLAAGFCGGDPTALQVTLEAVNLAIGRVGNQAAAAGGRLAGGGVVNRIPDRLWLDTLTEPGR